jgi:Mn-dependent DtxR family transcriptional regulator
MSNFPKLNLESEENLLLLFDNFNNSVIIKKEENQTFINEFESLNLLIKDTNTNNYTFTDLGLEFIKVLKNKNRRTTILKKMTMEDYILAIYYLSPSEDFSSDDDSNMVSMTELARYLGLSNSSISEYIRSLEKENYVTIIPRKGVKLTLSGFNKVGRLLEKRKILFEFVHDVLKIDKDLAEVESHVLEHNISPFVIDRMNILLKQLKRNKFSLETDA